MNLLEAAKLARNLMIQHGLTDWTFEFDNAKERFGACHHGLKSITLSRHLVLLNSEQHVLDVTLHEVAHALAPKGSHHNEKWRAIAKSIGCTGTRCYSQEVVTPPSKFIAICPKCERKYTRDRKIPKPSVYRCSRRGCNTTLVWRYTKSGRKA